MKKITILAALLFMSISMNAQVSFEGVSDYGRLQNMTYHPTIQNRIYAATQGNHLIISNDNGTNWSLLYSFPNSQTRITNLKFIGGDFLSFTIVGDPAVEGIYTFNTTTNSIASFFASPYTIGGAQITSYDLYDSQGSGIIANVSYNENLAPKSKVFHSSDGGTNWELIYYSDDYSTVQVTTVAISPVSKSKLFIGRSLGAEGINGGLLVSNDFGTTWTENMAGFPFSAITFNPINGDDIIVGTGISFSLVEERVYRSPDGGTTWNQLPITFNDQTLNCVNSIVFSPTDANKIILLDENEIIKSNDGGATWTSVVYPQYAEDYYYGLDASFNPFNDSQIAISTDFYPQMSIDGGITLSQIRVPYYNVTSVSHASVNGAKHLYYGAQGGRIHKNLSTSQSTIFESEQITRFNPKSHYLTADNNVPGRIFNLATRGFFGGIFSVSTDYGLTYTNLIENYATDSQEVLVDPTNNNIVYVSTRNGEGSTVNKINFSDLENVVTEEITTPEVFEDGSGVVTGFSIVASHPNEIYITKGNKFLKSSDSGLTWSEMMNGLSIGSSDLIWDMQRNPLDENQFTVGTNLGVFTTLDAGENWTQILFGQDVKRITYSPVNNGVIIASVHTGISSEATIYYTTDGGNEWSNVTPQEIKNVQSYGMDYDFDGTSINAYIATTDLGVIKFTIEDLALGVHNPVASASPISIYPNPASSELNIAVSGNAFEIKNTAIFSITGQKVMESTESKINISSLNTGIYIVNVKADNNTTYTQKLVKK